MLRRISAVPFVIAMAMGCTPHTALPPLHPVAGKVVNRGAPVNGGSVRFSRLDDPTPLIVNAAIDAAGHFELATLEGHTRHPGAPEGEYQVIYSPPVLGRNAFPETLPRTVKIGAQANDIVIDLAGD